MHLRPLIALAAGLVLALLARSAPAGTRPNVLFLLSDDHSYPFLSCYGDANVRTPTIDRLAAEGMKFHRFFTSSPQCVPSRAAFLTGRSPVAARITRFSSPLPRDEPIFPEYLRRDAGYYTGVCGRRYHLDGTPANLVEAGRLLDARKARTFTERMDFVEVNPPAEVPGRVAAFLDRRPADRPFFLWVNFSDPHHPWDAKGDEPDPATLKLPPYWPDTPSMRAQLAAYCGEINRLDRQVKDILDLLAARGLLDSTMIVFAGDNGLAFPHGKGSLYDPGCHVPFVVRWPGVVRPGTESSALLSGEDLAPTLLAAAGVAIPERITGVNFLPLLRGEASSVRQYVFTERGSHGSNAPVAVDIGSNAFDLSRAVRNGRYKFIYNCTPWIRYSPVDSGGDPAWRAMVAAQAAGTLSPALQRAYFQLPRPVYELYDLERDPSELENVAGTPAVAAIEHELRLALADKMILDYDYLPLPALPSDSAAAKKGKNRKGQKAKTP